MDFRCLKRRQLQKLCKKLKIPANSSKLEMANRLKEFAEGRENPAIEAETEPDDVKLNKKGKKVVQFRSESEVIEFTRSQQPKRRSKRNLGGK